MHHIEIRVSNTYIFKSNQDWLTKSTASASYSFFFLRGIERMVCPVSGCLCVLNVISFCTSFSFSVRLLGAAVCVCVKL